jgi:2-amino-4-hydroxy-6-hydroxymethyldihydropteridine diphosphokinase
MTQHHDMIYVALGSNQPFANKIGVEIFKSACAALFQEQIVPVRASSVWKTPAWPDPSQAPYFNAIIAVMAKGLSGPDVMAALLRTEREFGRVRAEKNAPRPLDLDLIDFHGEVRAMPCPDGAGPDRTGPDRTGKETAAEQGLILPHLRAHLRRFVLLPLREVAPDWVHPVLGLSINSLLSRLPDGGERRVSVDWLDCDALFGSLVRQNGQNEG